MLITKICSSVA